jgi:hypothetical protein
MDEFGYDAADIVPYAAQDGVNFGGRFFREGGCQIGAADPIFRQERADATHERAGEICQDIWIDKVQQVEQANRDYADDGIAGAFRAAAQAPHHPCHGWRLRTSQ